MEFTIDANDLRTYLERASLKKSLSDDLLIVVNAEGVYFYNGDSTCSIRIKLLLEEDDVILQGNATVSLQKILSFTKKFNGGLEISIVDGGLLIAELGESTKEAIIPRLNVETTYLQADALVNGITFSDRIAQLPSWNTNGWTFEYGATIRSTDLEDAISTCDVVKTGIYKFTADETGLSISSGAVNNGGRYKETLTTNNPMLEENAEVFFTYPLYSAFAKNQKLNIFLKDDSPIVMVSDDAILMKAPRQD